MTAVTLIGGLIVIWLVVILIRAALYRPILTDTPLKTPRPGRFDLDQAAQHLAEMVRCRTVAPENDRSNGKNGDGGFEQFEKFRRLLMEFYPLTHSRLEFELIDDHALLYRWVGKSSEKPLLLIAHYDVVPAEDEQWQHPPFDGVIKDGAIWGRGTIDTKCTLCGIFESVEAYLSEGFMPEQDIYLAFGHDEETTGSGAHAIAKVLKSRGVHPEMVYDEGGAIVLNAFPGVSKAVAYVGTSERGLANIEFILDCKGGHSNSPGQHTPFSVMSKIILSIEQKLFRPHMSAEVREMFDLLGRHTPFFYRIIFANLWCFKPLLVSLLTRVSREMNATLRSTCVFTMAEGSSAPNVMPERVRAMANLRLSARDPIEKAFQQIKAKALAASKSARQAKDPFVLEVNLLEGRSASPSSSTGSKAFNILKQTINESFQDIIVTPFISMGASDSRHYCAISENVFRFIPVVLDKEELRSMHGLNEKITVEKLGLIIEFYLNLIDRYQSQI
jgi:carboxypeptidase PM20D1